MLAQGNRSMPEEQVSMAHLASFFVFTHGVVVIG